MGKKKQSLLYSAGIAALLSTIWSVGTAHATSQPIDISDRVESAVEAVQEGLEILWPEGFPKEDFSFRLGIGTGFTPDYVGSDNYRLRFLPILEVKYKDVWRLNGTKLSYTAISRGHFEAGPLINYRFGRSESQNKALRGLGNISDTVEVGGFIQYRTKKMLLNADFRQALGASQGQTLRLTVGHGILKKGPFFMGVGARAKIMNKKGMQTNFGITQQQSDQSEYGFTPYEAKAGFSEVSGNVVAGYRLNENARIVSLLSVGRLLNGAKNSPLVTSGTGSKYQIIAGTAITFSF
ncbi:MipA/OmpV family protein [Kordiimonas sediminis]|nr:MipA/OmpV family protein [Kordiimonas sediminis]